LLPALAASQSMTGTQETEESTPQLELAKDPGIETGQIAAVQGRVDSEGRRYTVGSLSILQPVVVTLLAHDEADDLTLLLFKQGWSDALRTGSTRGKGLAQFE